MKKHLLLLAMLSLMVLSGWGRADSLANGLGVKFYAGISLTNPIGSKYTIEYVDSVEQTNWKILATGTLSNITGFIVDQDSPNFPNRFYKVVWEVDNGNTTGTTTGTTDGGTTGTATVPASLSGAMLMLRLDNGEGEKLTFAGNTFNSDLGYSGSYTFTPLSSGSGRLLLDAQSPAAFADDSYNLLLNFTTSASGLFSGNQHFEGSDHFTVGSFTIASAGAQTGEVPPSLPEPEENQPLIRIGIPEIHPPLIILPPIEPGTNSLSWSTTITNIVPNLDQDFQNMRRHTLGLPEIPVVPTFQVINSVLTLTMVDVMIAPIAPVFILPPSVTPGPGNVKRVNAPDLVAPIDPALSLGNDIVTESAP